MARTATVFRAQLLLGLLHMERPQRPRATLHILAHPLLQEALLLWGLADRASRLELTPTSQAAATTRPRHL
jgi:hypothetical protein